MKNYNKLVRDRIPEIITAGGATAITRILDADEYGNCLRIKLQEEVQEFLSDRTVEELADIYEVILAILKHMRVPQDLFQQIREKKAQEKGRFDDRVYLEFVVESK